MHDDKLLAALDFLRREKRMVSMIATFVLASLVVRCTSARMDAAALQMREAEKAPKANPWAKDAQPPGQEVARRPAPRPSRGSWEEYEAGYGPARVYPD
ncbi:MAG TPA: hypothetical protein VGE05_02145 [Novosphingobium sp.]